MYNEKSVENKENVVNVLAANGDMVYNVPLFTSTKNDSFVNGYRLYFRRGKAVSSSILRRSFLLVSCNPSKS